MSASCLSKTTINQFLNRAEQEFKLAKIPSPELDAEIILAYALKKDRVYLHAHPQEALESSVLKFANTLLSKRVKRIPVAYLVGKKEFYGRDFIVNKNTLIPRPETEDIIDVIKKIIPQTQKKSKLIDVGTGSGCIGITLKLELPKLDVELYDISEKALGVARKNSKKFGANVQLKLNDLLEDYNKRDVDVIVANLPYVDKNWDMSPEINFEPKSSLFAKENGLYFINKLIKQTEKTLKSGGYLILEADPVQHQQILKYARKFNLEKFEIVNYIISMVKKI